jgi:hypothetical protein
MLNGGHQIHNFILSVRTFLTLFYYCSGSGSGSDSRIVINYVPIPLRSIFKLRFRFRYGKKLRVLRFRFRNTDMQCIALFVKKVFFKVCFYNVTFGSLYGLLRITQISSNPWPNIWSVDGKIRQVSTTESSNINRAYFAVL